MQKIKINLADLKDALDKSGLLDWKDNPADFDVDIEIKPGDNPSAGEMVSVLTLTLDKNEQDYAGTVCPVRKVVEIFELKANQNPRITTEKSQEIPRRKKVDKDEIPF